MDIYLLLWDDGDPLGENHEEYVVGAYSSTDKVHDAMKRHGDMNHYKAVILRNGDAGFKVRRMELDCE